MLKKAMLSRLSFAECLGRKAVRNPRNKQLTQSGDLGDVSRMTGESDYFQLRAVRLLALALKLREKGSIEQADAIAGIALQCLDDGGIPNSLPAMPLSRHKR